MPLEPAINRRLEVPVVGHELEEAATEGIGGGDGLARQELFEIGAVELAEAPG